MNKFILDASIYKYKNLAFQLQSYYTFNIILHATLEKYHYRGVGREIMLNLKFPYNGSHNVSYNCGGYTTSKLPAASETQQIELSKDAFPQLLKSSTHGVAKTETEPALGENLASN